MATEVKKGITIEFRGDSVHFDNTLENINRALRLLQAENARINRSLKFDPNNVELLNQKFQNLQTSEKLANERLQYYREGLLKTITPTKELTESSRWKELQTKINACETVAKYYTAQLNETVDENGKVTDVQKWTQLRANLTKNADVLHSYLDEMITLAEKNGAITDVERWMNLKQQIIKAEQEVANLENQADKASKRLSEIANGDIVNNLKALRDKAYEVGNAFTAVGNALKPISTLASTALTGSTSKFAEFEEAFAGVKKTVEATPAQFARLSDEIRKMSKEIPATTTEINAVAEVAGQLGVSVDSLSDFTRIMIDLGNSTNVTADEASTNIARIFNIVNGGVNGNIDNVKRFGSALVALGNNSATTEEEILNMTTRLAGAGSIYGITNQHLLALATAMSSVGLRAESGGSAVSTIMNNIEKSISSTSKSATQKISAFAELTDMTVEGFKQAWGENAFGTLMKVIKSLNSVRAEGDSVVSVLDDMGISNIRQTDTMLRLVSAADQVQYYIDLANGAWEENTALTNEANKRYETMQSKLTILKNAFEDFMVSIGEKIAPIIIPLIEKLTDFLNTLSNSSGFVNSFTVALTALISALSPMALGIGKVVKGWGGLFEALVKINEEDGKTVKGFDDIFTRLGKIAKGPYDTINQKMLGMFGKIGEGIQKIWNYQRVLKTDSEQTHLTIGGLWDALKTKLSNFATGTLTKVGNGFKLLWEFMSKNPIVAVVALIAILVASFITAYQNSEEFRNKVDVLWQAIKNNLAPVIETLWNALKALGSWAVETLAPIAQMFYDTALEIWDAIGDLIIIIVNLVRELTEKLAPIVQWLWEKVLKPLVTFLVQTLGSALWGIFDVVGSIISKVVKLIDKLTEALGLEKKVWNASSYVNGHDYDESRGGGGRVSVLDYYPGSGGLGLNYGLAGGGMGGTITLNTDFVVNNNGDPINETTVRRWGKLITEVVSDELGRRI